MTKAMLIKVGFLMGLACSFRGSVHYRHGEKHGSIQADKVLQELAFSSLVRRQPGGDCLKLGGA
jgi:hypothetical protein